MDKEIKVCIVSDAHQDKYIHKFNTKISKIKDSLSENFQHYVCTTNKNLIDVNSEYLKIFELEELQKRDPKTIQHEQINTVIGYRDYHWNLRRHIINQGFIDNFDYVIWNDCDVDLAVDKQILLDELNKYEINNIYTQNTIWTYVKDKEKNMFANCDKVLSDFNSDINKESLTTHDGPTTIYYFDKEHQKKFIELWDQLTLYGYETGYFRKGNWFIPNLNYVIGMSKVGLKPASKKFFSIHHVYEDRY